MTGEVGILNVGAGDTKLSFDKSNPAERDRAKRIVQDMLKRGYALLIEVGRRKGEPIYQRAHGFDPETCEYIILGGPDEKVDIGMDPVAARAKPGPKGPTGPRRGRRVPADGTSAVAVGRVAGG